MSSPATGTAAPAKTTRKRRMRFSLLALILVTALFCIVLSHVLTSRELYHVRQEAKRLRDELGYLTIADESKLHAIAIAAEEGYFSKRWRWRIYFPAGREYRVCHKFVDLPTDGIPDDNYEFFSDVAGEMTLAASAVREPDGSWRLVLHYNSPGGPYSQTRSQVIAGDAWLREDASMSWNQAGAETTDSVEPGEPMVLLRMRRVQSVTLPGGAQRQMVDANPTDGLMLWIEEAR